MKYWQLYCDLYPIMTQPGSGRFPHQFSEEFVRCYENQIAEFNRLDRNGAPKNNGKPADNEPPARYDEEELVDQTEEASYADQF